MYRPLPLDHPAFDAQVIGGLTPFVCSYYDKGRLMCITLHGSEPAQILEDHCDSLEGLRVDGQLVSNIPQDNAEAWAMIDAYAMPSGEL